MRGVWRFLVVLMCVLGASGAQVAAVGANPEKPLAGDDLKMAIKMNDVYARHLYSSVCVEGEKRGAVSVALSPEENAKRMQMFKSACDCLVDQILKESSPNDVIDYVTAINGGRKSTPESAGKIVRAFPNVPEGSAAEAKLLRIGDIGRDEKIRKDCGFAR